MSDNGLPAPAWYEDPANPTQERWWDGAAWTEHVQQPPVAPAPVYSAPVEPSFSASAFAEPQYNSPHTEAPAYAPMSGISSGPGVIYRDIPSRWGTVPVWLLALSPLLAGIPFIVAALIQGAIEPDGPTSYTGLIIALIVFFLLPVVWAYLDANALRAFGYERAPHWAWVFLTPLAYLIVRFVRTRAQAGVGGAPLWTHIALVVTLPFTAGILSAVAIPVFLNQQESALSADGAAISANAEVSITTALVDANIEFTDVECPENVRFAANGAFACNFIGPDGQMTPIMVTFGATREDPLRVEDKR